VDIKGTASSNFRLTTINQVILDAATTFFPKSARKGDDGFILLKCWY
jgi:hypothetical protein